MFTTGLNNIVAIAKLHNVANTTGGGFTLRIDTWQSRNSYPWSNSWKVANYTQMAPPDGMAY